MSEALFVFNPRDIPACVEAIGALDIPTCWLSYMPESHAAQAANDHIAATGFDRYLLLSDDTMPTQKALNAVTKAAMDHPVVTGWCNLDERDHKHLVNLCSNTLPPPPPEPESYTLMRLEDVRRKRKPFRTTFAGFALTAVARDVLVAHPLEVSPNGGQLDYMLSYRLQEAGIPIMAAPGAFVRHVKENWNLNDEHPAKRLLVGERAPTVRWT